MTSLKRQNKGIAEAKREQRRVEAETRQTKHEALSPIQKLAKLDAKLGKGVGAKKERAQLEALL